MVRLGGQVIKEMVARAILKKLIKLVYSCMVQSPWII